MTKAPIAYKLVPMAHPPLLAQPESLVAHKGFFATKQLWVTPHADDQMWPAGDYVFGAKDCTGLKLWTKEVRSRGGQACSADRQHAGQRGGRKGSSCLVHKGSHFDSKSCKLGADAAGRLRSKCAQLGSRQMLAAMLAWGAPSRRWSEQSITHQLHLPIPSLSRIFFAPTLPQDASLEGADPVVWYSFGVTHVVRPEDFPIMPVEVREGVQARGGMSGLGKGQKGATWAASHGQLRMQCIGTCVVRPPCKGDWTAKRLLPLCMTIPLHRLHRSCSCLCRCVALR